MSAPRRRNLWEVAVETLPAEDRKQYVPSAMNNTATIIEDLLNVVKEKQRICMDKRWRIRKKNSEQIVLRDVFERTSRWLQKFREIGDIAVQYDTSGASLPWAAVRFLLTVATNDVQIFGAVAEGVETTARLIARCALYEAVYLGNASENVGSATTMLEDELILMYSSILKYLARAATYYARGTAKRVLGSVVDSTAGTKEQLDTILKRETDLEKVIQLVQGKTTSETVLALQSMGHAHQEQHHAIQRLGELLNQTTVQTQSALKQVQTTTKADERAELSRWLSTVNHREVHNQTHRDVLFNTGGWLFRHENYSKWESSASSSALWIRGMPGCGKTKLVSHIVQKLLDIRSVHPNLPPIAYFYCSDKVCAQHIQSTNTVLTSILKQLSFYSEDGMVHPFVYSQFKQRRADAQEDGVEMTTPSLEECMQMLESVTRDCAATIIIDGLDELEEDPADLIRAIKTLNNSSERCLKVLIASRDEPTISTHFQTIPYIEITPQYNSDDVTAFIESGIDSAIQEKRLLQGKVRTELRDRIVRSLTERASGMFLWASLHIQQLCDQQRYKLEKDVVDALDITPASLQSLFDLMYLRIEQYPDTARRITESALSWLLVAERPLSKSELFTAACYGEIERLTEEDVLNLCSGFIVHDLLTGQVSFAHLSIRQYLQRLQVYAPPKTNALVAGKCLQCLLDGDGGSTEGQFDERSSDATAFQSYSTRYWARHYSRASNASENARLNDLLFAFLLEDGGQHFDFWIEDVQMLLDENLLTDLSLRAELSASISDSKSSIFVASVYGLTTVIGKLHAIGAIADWNLRNKFNASSLYASARYGQLDLVEKLIELGADANAIGGYLGTPLQAAAYQGHDAIVESLLAAGANATQKGKFDTALHAAVAGAHESTTQLLLSALNTHDRVQVDMLLTQAAYSGLYAVVNSLSEGRQERDMHEKTTDIVFPHDALQAALYRGRARVATKLLKDLPDINMSGGHFENALQAACLGGHYTLTKNLLDLGADPNLVGRYGSPLKAAALGGHDNVVSLLISRSAILEASVGKRNALEAAAARGHLSTVQILVRSYPAEMTKRPDRWSSRKNVMEPALLMASKGGFCELVEYLLDHGAEPYATRALETAIASHRHQVTQILLARIPKIDDYTRFEVISHSSTSRDAWIHANYDQALSNSDPPEDWWKPKEDADTLLKGQYQFFHSRVPEISWWQQIRVLDSDIRGKLGMNHPQGMKYIQTLAAYRGSRADFEALIERGLDISGYSPSPIEAAAKGGNLDVLDLLLDRSVPLRGALQVAVFCRQTQAARLILLKRPDTDPDLSADANKRSKHKAELAKQSALAIAVELGEEDMVSLLLDHKRRSSHPGPGAGLLRAIQTHHNHLTQMILDATCATHDGPWSSSEELIISKAARYAIGQDDMALLQRIIDSTNILSYGRARFLDEIIREAAATTQLVPRSTEDSEEWYCRTGTRDTLVAIPKRASKSLVQLQFLRTLTHPAEHAQMASAILFAQRETPATMLNNLDLLDSFVSPHASSRRFKDALRQAFETLLRELEYNTAVQLLDRFPEHGSIMTEPQILQALLKYESSNTYNWDGAISEPQMKDMLKALRSLIKAGAQVNGRDDQGNTPLYYVCCKGWDEAFNLLLDAGADVYATQTRTKAGDTPQNQGQGLASDGEIAMSKPVDQELEIVDLLQISLTNFRIYLYSQQDPKRHRQWTRIIFYLLDARLTCELDDPGLVRLLESACNLGLNDDVEKLLNPNTWTHVLPVPAERHFTRVSSSLYLAIKMGRVEVATTLLKHGFDPCTKQYDAEIKKELSPIRRCLAGNQYNLLDGWGRVCDMLVDHGVFEEDAEALLKYAVQNNQHERMRYLLGRGVKVSNIPGNISADALEILLEEEYRPALNFDELRKGLASYIRYLKQYDHIMKRFEVLETLNIDLPSFGEVSKALLENWELPGKDKISLLDNLLPKYNHDINAAFPCPGCGNPITLLFAAMRHHCTDVFKALLQRGADAENPVLPYRGMKMLCRDPSRFREDAAIEMAQALLDCGVDVNGSVDTQQPQNGGETFQQTPLMYAIASEVYAKSPAMTRFLIQHGADVNKGFVAPLNLALRLDLREKKLIDLLLKSGATTRQHDVTKEHLLDPALGLSQNVYWDLRNCGACSIYKKY